MIKKLFFITIVAIPLLSLQLYAQPIETVGTHAGDFEFGKLEVSEQPDLSQVTEKYQRLYSEFFASGYLTRAKNYYNGLGYTEEISKFWTDGCSSSPDGTKGIPNLWRDCCLVHDIAYWRGGPIELKEQADLELNQCLNEKVSEVNFSEDTVTTLYSWLGTLAENSVAFGGGPQVYAPWRWSYGWMYYIGYTPLTDRQNESFIFHLRNYMKAIENGTVEYPPRDKKYLLQKLHDIYMSDI